MNVDNNKLYNHTELKIYEAYRLLLNSKNLKKITVQDICIQAQIHRTTFYRHFHDLPDLQAHHDQYHLEKIFQTFVHDGIWNLREGIMKQLQFFFENRNVILRNLNNLEDYKRLTHLISGSMTDAYVNSYMEKYHCESSNEVLYHREFFSSGFTALIIKWIEGGCEESPEVIGEYIYKIFDL